jgi:hypothetical protein
MNSSSGLKRSMPCNDLISMSSRSSSSGSKDTSRPFPSKRLKLSSGKRQPLISLASFEDISSISFAEENPATAALEKNLVSFQEEKDIHVELLESHMAGIQQLTCAVDFLFADFVTTNHNRHIPCKAQRKSLLSLSHVPDMSDVTHVLSRMTTSA